MPVNESLTICNIGTIYHKSNAGSLKHATIEALDQNTFHILLNTVGGSNRSCRVFRVINYLFAAAPGPYEKTTPAITSSQEMRRALFDLLQLLTHFVKTSQCAVKSE